MARGRFSAFVLILLLSCGALAQESSNPGVAGAWDIGVWAAGATGEESTNSLTEAQVSEAGVYVGKFMNHEAESGWRRGILEYGFNVIPLFITSKSQRVHGGALEPLVLRWNFARGVGRISPYVELAGGGVFTTANLPAGNTSTVNFSARGGGGFRVFAGKRQSLDIGCSWSHISNANLGNRNPEFNGIEVKLGYHRLR